MLRTVLQDFQQAGIQTVTLAHASLDWHEQGEVLRIKNSSDEEKLFKTLAAGTDATLVIAPETSNILHDRVKWILEASGVSLGASPEAIRLTGDKLRCGEWWRKNGVPTPTVQSTQESPRFPCVVKPRVGAGSQATKLVQNGVELVEHLEQTREFAGAMQFITQDFVTGQAASVAFLIGPGGATPLVPTAQLLSEDNRFQYLGGSLPLPPALATRALLLGRQAVECISGLRGYIGVDLVLGNADDGSADFAIEINPRLTTSYLGLRRLARDDLAMAMLRVCLQREVLELRWRDEKIHFRNNGEKDFDFGF